MNDDVENNDLASVSGEVMAGEIEMLQRENPYRSIFELLDTFSEKRQAEVYRIAEGLDTVIKGLAEFDLTDRAEVIKRLNAYIHQFV